MMQTIIVDFPPLYGEIAAVFRIHDRRDVVFSWGDRLFNPYDVYIPPEIIAHEAVHGMRQGEGNAVFDWWQRYMEDRTFRFMEELHAHRAEYRYLLENGRRSERRSALKHVAGKLASPLYGRMVSVPEARSAIKGAI